MRSRRGWDFAVVYGVTAALAALISLPVLVVALGSVLDTSFLGLSSEQWAGETGNVFTLRWFRYVLELYGGQMWFSAQLSLGSSRCSFCRRLECLAFEPPFFPGCNPT